MLLCIHRIHAKFTLHGRLGENVRIIMFIKDVVGNMLNDSRCLFFIDDIAGTNNEFFRIVFELIERNFLNACKNLYDSFTSKASFINQFSDQVVFDTLVRSNCILVRIDSRLSLFESVAGCQGFF